MSAATVEHVAVTQATDDDDLVHTFCCDEDTGLCGADLRGARFVPWWCDELLCVVCEELIDEPCRWCDA